MDDRWLSVDENAEYLGVSKDAVYTWILEAQARRGRRVGPLGKAADVQANANDE